MKVNKVRWKTIGCECCRKFAERTRPWFQWCRSATWQAPPWRSCRNHIQEAIIPITQISGMGSFAFPECFGLWFKLVDRIINAEKPGNFWGFLFGAQMLSHVMFFAFGMSLDPLICHMYKSYFDWLVKKVWSYNISPAICMSRILCFKYWPQQLTLACLGIQRTAMRCFLFRLERKHVVCFDMCIRVCSKIGSLILRHTPRRYT